MRTPWFKLWTEARTDNKLRSLTDSQFRVWFNLLCYAAEQPERGVIESEDDDLLALEVANGDVHLLAETLETLAKRRCVSCVSSGVSCNAEKRFMKRKISFMAFAKRNGNGVSSIPKVSTDRVRKFRERKRLGKLQLSNETHETPGNARETRCSETHETPGNSETLQEVEKRRELRTECVPKAEAYRPESNPTNTHTLILSSPQRSADDLADVHRAEALLAANLQTEHIAQRLGRSHGLNGMVLTPGWKFLRAAERLTSGEAEPRKLNWGYFLGIVKNLTDAERNAPKGGGKPTGPSPPSHAENFGPAWYYRRRGLPLPVGHPEYGKEGPDLPQDASSDDFGSPDPPGV